MQNRFMIRPASSTDSQGIADIYNYYIKNTVITFEEEEVSADEISSRISEIIEVELPWLVAEEDGVIVGYAYASQWNGRCAYRYTAEITVYLASDQTGNGLGTRLYESLFDELKHRSYRVAIGGIALPNAASIALHEKLGMKKVAHFEEVGFKFDQWIDVGYWQGKLSHKLHYD